MHIHSSIDTSNNNNKRETKRDKELSHETIGGGGVGDHPSVMRARAPIAQLSALLRLTIFYCFT